jgi:hypothetical protein
MSCPPSTTAWSGSGMRQWRCARPCSLRCKRWRLNGESKARPLRGPGGGGRMEVAAAVFFMGFGVSSAQARWRFTAVCLRPHGCCAVFFFPLGTPWAWTLRVCSGNCCLLGALPAKPRPAVAAVVEAAAAVAAAAAAAGARAAHRPSELSTCWRRTCAVRRCSGTRHKLSGTRYRPRWAAWSQSGACCVQVCVCMGLCVCVYACMHACVCVHFLRRIPGVRTCGCAWREPSGCAGYDALPAPPPAPPPFFQQPPERGSVAAAQPDRG